MIIHTVQDIQEAIMKICDRLVNDYGVRFIILFGSIARGESSESSDIDIAVLIDRNKYQDDIDMELEIGVLLEKTLETESVDLVILNKANPNIRFEIIRDGVPILVDDEGEYEDYCIVTASEYYDYKEFFEKQYQSAKEMIKDLAEQIE